MADDDSARQAILDKIEKLAKQTSSASSVMQLAEALAWLERPDQSHGGHGA